jgi:exodeoxyribonuclease-3
MEIYSWNVNGARSAWGKGLSDFIDDVKPDILCLQEVKAFEEQFPEGLKSEFDYLYTNSATKPGYSGVAVLTKEEPKQVVTKLGHSRFDAEGRLLLLEYNDYTLLNLYLPHGGRNKENLAYKLEVYGLLLNLLERFKAKKTIIVGDFNIAHEAIDLERPRENINNIMFTPEEREIIDKLVAIGYKDTLREITQTGGLYTWWPYMANARERNLGWRIDYGFVSREFLVDLESAFTCPKVFGSDHCPIGVKLK